MKMKKLGVAVAALALGMQMGTVAQADVALLDVADIAVAVQEGDVAQALGLLKKNPDLLKLNGVLGDAIRAFVANPTDATLQALNAAGGTTPAAVAQEARSSGVSLY